MSVIITAKDCSLSEPNAFYRVESYQTSGFPSTSTISLSLAAARTIPLTFANAGNFKGVVLGLYCAATGNRGVMVTLQDIKNTVTITIASPGVVTLNTHGYLGSEPISFSTTGALPTGITANTTYYVKYKDANTFNVSSTPGGTNINFTGTQSGTQTLWDIDASAYLSYNEITNGISGVYSATYNYYWLMDVNFNNFDNVVAVDASANKWRLTMYQSGGTVGTMQIFYNRDRTTHPYYAYCDTSISFTNDDTPVFAHYCDIDVSASFASILGTGDTVYGVCGVICSNPRSTSNDDVAFLRCINPAESYTLDLKGKLIANNRAGIKVGDPSTRIPADKGFILNFKTANVGTAHGGIIGYHGTSSTTHYRMARQSINMYGEYPTPIGTLLSADAELLQNVIIVDDVSTWEAGDQIVIGKEELQGGGEFKKYTIQSINGHEITLTGNLTNTRRLKGGIVINLTPTKYGVNLLNPDTQAVGFSTPAPSSMILDGVYSNTVYGMTLSATPASTTFYMDDSDVYITPIYFKNMAVESTSTTYYIFVSSGYRSVRKGTYFDNWWGYRMGMQYNSTGQLWQITNNYKSGIVNFTNCGVLNCYTSASLGVCGDKVYIDGLKIQNQGAENSLLTACRPGSILKNIDIYGCNSGSLAFYAASLDPNWTNNCIFENINIDKTTYGLYYYQEISSNNTFKNIVFGPSISAPTMALQPGTYINDLFIDCSMNIALYPYTDLQYPTGYAPNKFWQDGSKISFVNHNNVKGNDFTYKKYGILTKCAPGLDDTTGRDGGSSYTLRFEPNDGSALLDFTQTVPGGDLQGIPMRVSGWVKINDASYYGGEHINPTLTVTYDSSTTTTSTAIDSSSWQQLEVSFTPTTDYPTFDIAFSGATDVSANKAYFYLTDILIKLPSDKTYNYGDMSQWKDGLPATPSIIVVDSSIRSYTTNLYGTTLYGSNIY